MAVRDKFSEFARRSLSGRRRPTSPPQSGLTTIRKANITYGQLTSGAWEANWSDSVGIGPFNAEASAKVPTCREWGEATDEPLRNFVGDDVRRLCLLPHVPCHPPQSGRTTIRAANNSYGQLTRGGPGRPHWSESLENGPVSSYGVPPLGGGVWADTGTFRISNVLETGVARRLKPELHTRRHNPMPVWRIGSHFPYKVS